MERQRLRPSRIRTMLVTATRTMTSAPRTPRPRYVRRTCDVKGTSVGTMPRWVIITAAATCATNSATASRDTSRCSCRITNRGVPATEPLPMVVTPRATVTVSRTRSIVPEARTSIQSESTLLLSAVVGEVHRWGWWRDLGSWLHGDPGRVGPVEQRRGHRGARDSERRQQGGHDARAPQCTVAGCDP